MNLKLLFCSIYDSGTVQSWSGIPFNMVSSLEQAGFEVEPCYPLDTSVKGIFLPLIYYYRAAGLGYRTDREPILLKYLARKVERKIRQWRPDVVFSPTSLLLSHLDTDAIKVFSTDATFSLLMQSYGGRTSASQPISARYTRIGNLQESRALQNCDAAVYPSEWAARSGRAYLGRDAAGKVHVIPYGANLPGPERDAVLKYIKAREFSQINILFIGGDWERKGGPLVVATCEELLRRGYNVKLHIVGAASLVLPAEAGRFAVNYGRLRKDDKKEYEVLKKLLIDAHFFFMPSEAECFGIVFAEAAAYGLPVITSNVGGITSAVLDGGTGYCLPLEAKAPQCASVFARLIEDRPAYEKLALAARNRFEEVLNWETFGRRVRELVAGIAETRSTFARRPY